MRCGDAAAGDGWHADPWPGGIAAHVEAIDRSGRAREVVLPCTELGAVCALVPAQEALVREGRADQLDLDPISEIWDESLDCGVERLRPLTLQLVVLLRSPLEPRPELVRLSRGEVGMDHMLPLRRHTRVKERWHRDKGGLRCQLSTRVRVMILIIIN